MKRWPTIPLGKLITIEKGKKTPEAFAAPTRTSVRYLQIEDLRPNANIKYCEPFNCPKATNSHVIIAWDGANAGTVSCNLAGHIGSTLAVLRPIADNTLSPVFLSRFLEGNFDYLQRTATGATIPHVSKDALNNLQITVLPLAEQERIVKLLGEADELRKLRAQADRRTADLIPALFHEMFGNAAANCKTATIEDAVEQFIDYRGKTPEKSPSGVPLVTAKIVKGGSILPPSEFIPEENYNAWMRRGLPREGDVLFTMEAPLGEVAMVENTRIALAQRILLMRPRCNLLDSRYFMTALKMPSVWKQIEERATGSTVRGIRQAELRKVQLPIPPLPLQKEFAARVTEIRAMQAAQATSRRRLENLFQSMLHRAFKGEL